MPVRSMITRWLRLNNPDARTLSAWAPRRLCRIERCNDLLGCRGNVGRELDAALPRRIFQGPQLLGRGVAGVGESRYAARGRNQLDQQLLPLAVELGRQNADAGRIATGMGKRAHETAQHQIVGNADDRDCPGRLLRGAGAVMGTGRGSRRLPPPRAPSQPPGRPRRASRSGPRPANSALRQTPIGAARQATRQSPHLRVAPDASRRGGRPAPALARAPQRHGGWPRRRAGASTRAASFDDLVGAGEDRLRDGQAERLGGLEIDDQLEFCRLLRPADRPAWRP